MANHVLMQILSNPLLLKVRKIVTQSHRKPYDSFVKPLQQAVRSEGAKAIQHRAVHIQEVAPKKAQRALALVV